MVLGQFSDEWKKHFTAMPYERKAATRGIREGREVF
jgi:hypothetical protein